MANSANHIELTSLDFARLIQFAARKFYKMLLNKTQINKILFYVYGVYLAETDGNHLFTDDTPKAWPFGPVFPKVYKKIDTDEIVNGFSPEYVKEFQQDQRALSIVESAVRSMHNMSAYDLTKWSHEEGSPWYFTIYNLDQEGNVKSQNPWNTRIEDNIIKEYFSKKENRFKES
jgi:uncharacterized phage-associated protein